MAIDGIGLEQGYNLAQYMQMRSGQSGNFGQMEAEAFARFDLDSSGGLSLNELQAARQEMPMGQFSPGNNAMEEAFNAFDADGNGELNRDEAFEAFSEVKSRVASTMLEIQEMMSGPTFNSGFNSAFGGGFGGSNGSFGNTEGGLASMIEAIKAYGEGDVSREELATEFAQMKDDLLQILIRPEEENQEDQESLIR